MHAHVYKSLRKADTYVYLAQRDGFDALPEGVRAQLGALEYVLEVELSPERRLARADAAQVREALDSRGFFLQMPPPPNAAAYDAGEYYRSRDA
ncbi:YcgL domain-containing protein [Lysobacter claricitrinus]|uniref:YcgL domain-containing protein n=1 Tax=Lysobacter claricitrinus TaxID=3367728 RepID=UPI0037DAB1EB